MPALVVPPSGVSLEGPRKAPTPDIFSLNLRDSVIEEMIKCYNSGKTLQLSLGEHPSLQYGTKTQHLSSSIDPFTHELFRSSNSKPQPNSPSPSPNGNTYEIPQERVISEVKTSLAWLGPLSAGLTAQFKKMAPPTQKIVKTVSRAADGDPAVAALRNSLASENAKKAENTTKYIKDGAGLPGHRGGPAGKKAAGKSKLLSQNRALSGDTSRSMPPSPALSGAGSPSLGPTSVPLSQQQLVQAKATRKPVVHLLALAPMTEVALRAKVPTASNSDLKQALQKVGDVNQSTGRWELRRLFYKELDVWSFDYATTQDREKVIDNTVKQYDKMRLGVSEPEWDRLLPQAERGTGKCLSKLQAQIAQGPAARAPKTNVQKAGDGSSRDGSNGEDESVSSDKNPASTKSESTARPATHPAPAKAKKVSEKPAVEKVVKTKRWMSAKNSTKEKATPAKKERPNTKHGKFLSSEFVNESDDDDDEEMPPAKPAPKSVKRPREDEEETSDSSIPLSKKLKEDPAHRTSDASQSSRAFSTTSANLSKPKDSSPQKSSPLSSPPTNASEFESSSGHISSSASPAHHNAKGRHSPIYKPHQKSSSVTSSVSSNGSHRSLHPEVVDLARRYRSFYPKYEALHREVANSGGRRNPERERELLDMHERLRELKERIVTGIVYVEN